jgi:hypothetical protein
MTKNEVDYEYVARHAMAKSAKAGYCTTEHGLKHYQLGQQDARILQEGPSPVYVVDGTAYRLNGDVLCEEAAKTYKWDGYEVPKRVRLCKLAGLSGKLGSKSWTQLTPEERTTLKEAIRARKLAKGRAGKGKAAHSDDPHKKPAQKPKASFLMWVGAEHYPTYRAFAEEARVRGVSKRIGRLSDSIVPGQTVVYLAHDDGIEGRGFVFGFFVVNRVELVLKDGATLPDWAQDKVRVVAFSEAQLEEERGCGWRQEGGLYLMGDVDRETMKRVAAELGYDRILIDGMFAQFEKPFSLDTKRFRGLLQFDSKLLRKHRKPTSDKYPPAKKGHTKWTKAESRDLLQRLKDRPEGDSKMKVMALYGYETQRSRHQVVYQYNKLRTQAERKKAARRMKRERKSSPEDSEV